MNPDHTLSETNTANIIVVLGNTVICPQSAHALPGVMQDFVCRRFEAMGFTIVKRAVRVGGLPQADAVLLTNALMGVVPALSLDGQQLKFHPDLITSLNENLFAPTGGDDGL